MEVRGSEQSYQSISSVRLFKKEMSSRFQGLVSFRQKKDSAHMIDQQHSYLLVLHKGF